MEALLEDVAIRFVSWCDFQNKVFPPEVGSVVKVDLAGGLASHTGVCVGPDRIIEVTKDRYDLASVRVVTPKRFILGDDDSYVRTGFEIYVGVGNIGTGYRVLSSREISRRAIEAVGEIRGVYHLDSNNCHKFTRFCVTGEEFDGLVLCEDDIQNVLESVFGGRDHIIDFKWGRTGFSRCSKKFPGFVNRESAMDWLRRYEKDVENRYNKCQHDEECERLDSIAEVRQRIFDEHYHYKNGVSEDGYGPPMM